MDVEEIRADQTGSNVPLCDEAHYTRFLTKILPGPETTNGTFRCEQCGMYFDDKGIPMSSKKK